MKKNTEKTERTVKQLSLSTLAFILAAVMLFGGVVGATLAWLMDKTRTIENTFTLGNINDFRLEEPGLEENTNSQILDLYVDQKIVKAPYISVGAYTIDCYVYVKVDVSDNFGDYVDVNYNGGYINLVDPTDPDSKGCWQQLLDKNGNPVPEVYYLVHSKADTETKYQIIKGETDGTNNLDQPYQHGLLKAKATFPDDADYADAARPTMNVTGYAVQNKNIGTAYDGWLALVAEYPNNT